MGIIVGDFECEKATLRQFKLRKGGFSKEGEGGMNMIPTVYLTVKIFERRFAKRI